MGTFRNIFHLLGKNVTLAKRNKISTALMLFTPTLFMVLLFFLQMAFNNSAIAAYTKGSKLFPVDPQHNTVPNCKVSEYLGYESCLSLAYAPSNSFTDDLVGSLSEKLEFQGDEVRGFENVSIMDDFILHRPNYTQISLSFYFTDQIPFPSPLTLISFAFSINETVFMCDFSNILETGQECAENPFKDVYLPLYRAFYESLISYTASEGEDFNSTKINLNTRMFAHPASKSRSVVYVFLPMFLFACAMIHLIIQLLLIVFEKEVGLRALLSTANVSDFAYWTSWFSYFFLNMIISFGLMYTVGRLFDFSFFIKNDWRVVWALLVLFSANLVLFGFLFACVLQKAKAASVMGFLMFMLFTIINIVSTNLLYTDYVDGKVVSFVRKVFSYLSPTLFDKGLHDLGKWSNADKNGIHWDDIGTYSRFFTIKHVYSCLIRNAIVYFAMFMYFDKIIPQKYRIPKKWHFVFTWWYGSKRSVKKRSDLGENDDVLVIDNLTKYYGKFRAVTNLSLRVKRKSCVGLCGKNGASKTTTLLTVLGFLNYESGNISIGHVGFAPQFTCQWKELTCQEHIVLFSRLRGYSKKMAVDQSALLLTDMKLDNATHKKSAELSGGMQRRLQLGIASAGFVEIVLLDEVSSGLDIVTSFEVMKAIGKLRERCAVLFVTHNLFEAETLSDILCIIHHGELIAMDTVFSLKNKHGGGYKLQLALDDAATDDLLEYIRNNIGDVKSSIGSRLTVNIFDDVDLMVLKDLRSRQDEFGIVDLSLGLSSLEDVFINLVGQSIDDDDSDDENSK
ncbi:hypothetical protein PCE1_002103 [Barthelona sp. PCE]